MIWELADSTQLLWALTGLALAVVAFAAGRALGDAGWHGGDRPRFAPTAAVDPVGTLCWLLLGVGYVRPRAALAPVPSVPGALAGSAVAAAVGALVGLLAGFVGHDPSTPAGPALAEIAWVVLGFAIVGALPLPPLDGAAALAQLVGWRQLTAPKIWNRAGVVLPILIFVDALTLQLLAGLVGRTVAGVIGLLVTVGRTMAFY